MLGRHCCGAQPKLYTNFRLSLHNFYAPYLRFQQGQQSQRQGQKPRQTDDLLRLPDKQRAQAQGEVFEEMEIPFERPATPIVLDSLDQGQSVRRSIGDLDAPPQAMPPGGNGFLVPLYAGEGIADLDLGSHGTIRATPPTTYVAGH